MSDPISTKARGELRRWTKATAAKYAAWLELFKSDAIFRLGQDAVCKKGLGKERALRRLDAAFAGVAIREQMAHERPLAIWSVLKPRGSIMVGHDEPGFMQEAVIVNYGLFAVHAHGLTKSASGVWSVEFGKHCLGRILERHAGVDLDIALRQIHRDILKVNLTSLAPVIYVPALNGALVCKLAHGRDVDDREIARFVHFRTFLPKHLLSDQERRSIVKLDDLDDGAPRLSNILLPLPLQSHESSGRVFGDTNMTMGQFYDRLAVRN
jgi:hypothetical protein